MIPETHEDIPDIERVKAHHVAACTPGHNSNSSQRRKESPCVARALSIEEILHASRAIICSFLKGDGALFRYILLLL